MKLYVCFLWHMHQPHYKDPESGTYILPWVRLHAIKDYVALPRLFRKTPAVRHTFNLVPSLLIQARDYVENGAEDVFLALSRKNALDLTAEEEDFLLKNFFSAFPPTMILPQPRYADLYRRQEAARHAIGRTGVPGGFGASEYTDLMTLFNLAWFHPMFLDEDAELGRLWRKGRGYTERDKAYVLDMQMEVMGSLLTEYGKVAREDGGELSTSPMYHPILPLLIDNASAKDARPGAPLPGQSFAYPADAIEQLQRGRAVFRSLFGADPAGLWPSEGSISPAAMEIAAQTGFKWAATDEILLARALGKTVHRDADGIPTEPEWFYRPYRATTRSGKITIFFRDHHLSDLIGFEYSRWDTNDAVNNFIFKIGRVRDKLAALPASSRRESYVIPVILDGENAWEYYFDSGRAFLLRLMEKCGKMSPDISFVTFSEALRLAEPIEELPVIPTGSWIDGTFNIWIGHTEDHAAWEMLTKARNLYQLHSERSRRAGIEPSEHLKSAYEHVLVAEGSDWCWWYGDDHFTPHGPEYDLLFRHHIKAVFRELGEIPPDYLDIPIIKPERIPSVSSHLSSPRTYIHPKIDGHVSSYFEWSAATRYVPSPEFGAMHRAGHGLLACLFYGFDESVLYLRADFHSGIFDIPVPLELDIVFPAKNRKVSVLLVLENLSLRAAIGKIEENLDENHVFSKPDILSAAFQKVFELGIPFRELGIEKDERVEFFLTVHPKGSIGERWPMYGNFTAELPGKDFEERMWEA